MYSITVRLHHLRGRSDPGGSVTPTLRATKFHRPAIPAKYVARPHIIRRLNAGLVADHQVTLVSAPPGFGKTTTISDWVDSIRLPVSWLSLDSADNDPGRFLSYFVAALQMVDDNLGQEVNGVIQAGQLPSIEIISTTLSNDILEFEEQFLLVLDDFQVIQDPFILQVLEGLITPTLQPLHLVLLTREDPPLPLARLRANNQLTEIRVGDLRFTSDEAECFLNDVMELGLSRVDVASLEARTEGWVVGLQLVGLSIRDRTNPSSVIEDLRGSHRFILNYLAEEILNQQPEEIQQFLLQTSVLDKLCGNLCNAVTGRADSHILLEQLFNANLFLIPLDDQGQWYRYHQLFVDLLRNSQNSRLKDQSNELHQRASRWYAQANMGNEAIEHALAASDYAFAVDLLEAHATGMIMQGYAKTVDGWVQAIPEEWRSQNVKTYLAFAWMYALRGNYSQAFNYLDLLEVFFQDGREEDPIIKAEWMALQCLMLNMDGKASESLSLANQALDVTPEDADYVRSLIYMGLAGSHQLLDDYDRAVEAFRLSIQYGRMAGNFVAEMMSTAGLALLVLERGQLHLASEIASPVSERISKAEVLPPISAVVDGVLGEVHYHWHQIEQARDHILRAIHLSALGGYNTGAIYYRALLARLLQIEGDIDTAAEEIQKAVDRIQANAPMDIRQEVLHQQVRIYLAQDRLAAAVMALQGYGFSFEGAFTYPELDTGQGITYPMGLTYNSALQVLLYQAQGGNDLTILKSGIDLADRLIIKARKRQIIIVLLETLLLRAQMQTTLGNEQASQSGFAAEILDLAEQRETLRLTGGSEELIRQKENLAAASMARMDQAFQNGLRTVGDNVARTQKRRNVFMFRLKNFVII